MILKKVLYSTKVNRTRGWKTISMMHPLSRIVFITLLAAHATPNTVRAQVKAVPPISGVIGRVQSVTDTSVDVQTGSGLVHVAIMATTHDLQADTVRFESCHIHVLCRRCIGPANGRNANREANPYIPSRTAWGCRRQCRNGRGSGLKHSQQNDQWFSLSTCHIAVAHDKRYGAARQRCRYPSSLSRRRSDDFRAGKCPGHGSQSPTGRISRRRHRLLNNGQASERNAYHEQDLRNRSSGAYQLQAVRTPANESFKTFYQ